MVGGGGVADLILKSETGWNSGYNGVDGYGFSALPGSFRYDDGSFYGAGYGYGGY
jgi:hypothetical protein